MWKFLRLLSLMCRHQIATGNDAWMLYTKSLQITERLYAIEFSNDDLLVLKTLLKEIFLEYFHFFPEEAVKPKSHFLPHFAYMIKLFESLVKTLRFETKHSFFKRSLGLSRNKKEYFSNYGKKSIKCLCIYISKTKICSTIKNQLQHF